MLKWLVKAAAAFVVVFVVAYSPFTREILARRAIGHDVINPLDVNDTAALTNWPGSAESFLDMLHERCLRTHDRDEAACGRYLSHG
jgi:hypothetical protein